MYLNANGLHGQTPTFNRDGTVDSVLKHVSRSSSTPSSGNTSSRSQSKLYAKDLKVVKTSKESPIRDMLKQGRGIERSTWNRSEAFKKSLEFKTLSQKQGEVIAKIEASTKSI